MEDSDQMFCLMRPAVIRARSATTLVLSSVLSSSRFATGADYRRLLVDLLASDYPLTHEVIAYEAATLPIAAPRMERMPLRGIVEADLRLQTTLVIPPARPMRRDQAMLDRLAEVDLALSKDEIVEG